MSGPARGDARHRGPWTAVALIASLGALSGGAMAGEAAPSRAADRTQETAPSRPAAQEADALPPTARPPADAGAAYGCVVCHADKRRAFVQGIHSERGIRCDDCHGGDPSAVRQGPAHSGEFLGDPGKAEVVRLCGSCHSDVDRMRPFGLPADQVAEFRTSRHGQLLLGAGNTDAPTCTDCHDAHTILPPTDARSSVYPPRIPFTCAGCHADDERMVGYGIPTDQFARYRRSAHGVALLEVGNLAAPSCAGCHGSHSALPPRVTEIANVCGSCHVLVQRAFDRGAHAAAAAAGRIAGCTACHDNHDTRTVPPDSVAATCTRCHAAESPAAVRGREVQELIVTAAGQLEAAEEALEELGRSGRRVSDVRFRYRTARTAFLQFQQAQHGLDMERLEELSLRVRSISRDIRAAAESERERRFEHRLLLAPIWFLVLSGVLLAWFRLRTVRRERQGGDR